MTSDDFDRQVASVAALGEPVRRELYRYVVAQPEPVSREQAAAGVGVAHHVAKFHLDKLEEDGLLDVEYRRPPGRSGPGAGRPAKLYRRSARRIMVSLPEHRYDLAGRVLAEAVTVAQRSGRPVETVVTEAAYAAGRALGEQGRAAAAGANRGDRVEAARAVLTVGGYEPRVEAGRIVLANCPFHALAESYPELMCGINVDLVNGMLDALPATGLRATLDPAPGRCCVTVGRSATRPRP